MKVKLLKKLRKEFDWYWDKDRQLFIIYTKWDGSRRTADTVELCINLFKNNSEKIFSLVSKLKKNHSKKRDYKKFLAEKRDCLNK